LTNRECGDRMAMRTETFGGLLFLKSHRIESLGETPSTGGLMSSAVRPQTMAPVEGFTMSKTIPLTQGKVALVDDQDYEWLNQWKWQYKPTPNTGYAVRSVGPRHKQKRVYMHRIILNPPSGKETDHINSNGLDNRRCNLRACTRSQNHMNRRKKAGCTSQFKGVAWNIYHQQWQASLMVDYKRQHLGLFENEQDAARAYNAAARERFGEFARLNEVTE